MEIHLQPVSAVIVNFNAGPLLVECVCAALEQVSQVIVIDNNSSDASMAMLANQYSSDDRLVMKSAGENIGFSAGCNLGLRLATQPYVLFLNPDCILGSGSLSRMVDVLESDSKIGMVGGLLTNLDGSEQRGGRRLAPTPWRSFVRASGLSRLSGRWPNLFPDFHLDEQLLPDSPIEVEAVSGALMLVSNVAIADVGQWDEAYFLHCEDLDWCFRFRQRGWKILFVPDAPSVHYRGHCSHDKPIFVAWHKHRGMIRFYRKFFKQQYPMILYWLVVMGVWVRFLCIALFHFAKGIKRTFIEKICPQCG